jgi:hypothetical protein
MIEIGDPGELRQDFFVKHLVARVFGRFLRENR